METNDGTKRVEETCKPFEDDPNLCVEKTYYFDWGDHYGDWEEIEKCYTTKDERNDDNLCLASKFT